MQTIAKLIEYITDGESALESMRPVISWEEENLQRQAETLALSTHADNDRGIRDHYHYIKGRLSVLNDIARCLKNTDSTWVD